MERKEIIDKMLFEIKESLLKIDGCVLELEEQIKKITDKPSNKYQKGEKNE